MKLNVVISAVVAFLPVAVSLPAWGEDLHGEARQALRLYEKGMYGRSGMMFDRIARESGKADPAGWSLLCDVEAETPGYAERIETFVSEYPYSALIPQIRFRHALNLFDDRDYKAASEVLAEVDESSLYRMQRTAYVFTNAWCDLENGNIHSARDGFIEVEGRKNSDFTAPSRYGIAYIEYQLKHFEEAIRWFGKAASDIRFKDIADYYILECRFMLKDYGYVAANGEDIYEKAPQDRKEHLARIISEAYLVLGDAVKAREYYGVVRSGAGDGQTRSDWFYSGSLLYAVEDYEGAVESFGKMGEFRDSIGQVAAYNLGYSYIRVKDKVSAMNAFRQASALDYDDAIAEDAMFNYAKLAFDLNNDASVFSEYLSRFPSTGKDERIYSYMAVAALHAHDYAGAVEAYDKIEELDDGMKLNYMKANYLRANQLVRSGSYRKAVPCLRAAAYYSDRNSRFNQLARFWLAECCYRDGQYARARELFTELHNVSALYGQAESYLIPYNIAYCFFKEGDYPLSKKWFGDYLALKSVKYRKEALLRKADCDFAVRNYKAAAVAYDMVLRDYFNENDVYPYYQAALSYGLCGSEDRKIELLSHVTKASADAEFYPEALFELGRSYVLKEDDANARKCFDMLAESVKDSTYMAKAYIELGTLARNQSMFNEALGYYKTVVEEMPLSEYADDALLAIEHIYQHKNEPEEYFAYIDSIGKGGIKSEDEKENMVFNSAEQVFLSENYQKALVSLQSYMEKYPEGRHLSKADFYIAESYRQIGEYEKACDSYKMVIDGGEGSFAELSMLHFSDLSFRLERWEDAFGGYASLHDAAKIENNVYAALTGMMRSAFRGHMWENAAVCAEKVAAHEKTDATVKVEADYVRAKSYLASSRRDEAFAILERLAADVSGQYGAEAAYMIIQDCYDRGDFPQVEEKVYAFSDAGSPHAYWLVKCFIVLGDSFMERNEIEQAKATFESVRDGYVPSGGGDEIHDSVRMRLEKIEEIEAEQQN